MSTKKRVPEEILILFIYNLIVCNHFRFQCDTTKSITNVMQPLSTGRQTPKSCSLALSSRFQVLSNSIEKTPNCLAVKLRMPRSHKLPINIHHLGFRKNFTLSRVNYH